MGRVPAVLICDRSADMLEMVSMYLSRIGFQVHTCLLSDAADRVDPTAAIASTAPDVVIYDIDLPYEPRWREAMAVALAPHVSCPFIFTTTNRRVAEQLLTGTARAHLLVKPYELDQLRQAIDDALGRPLPPLRERRVGERRRGDRRT
jgi:DNA-binding response OmpR family regulator